MAEKVFYRVGKFVGQNKTTTFGVVAAMAIISWVVAGMMAHGAREAAPVVAAKHNTSGTPTGTARVDPLVEKCGPGIQAVMASAQAAIKARKIEVAYSILDECKQHMKDPEALALYRSVTVDVTRKVAEINAKSERAQKAQKKREGVTIGMSQQQVLDSAWGRPNKVNRTIRASGTHEQWVYGGGYLYFEDGVLTAIQN